MAGAFPPGFVRLVIASALAGGLAGCASTPDGYPIPILQSVPDEARESAVTTPDTPMQCVPYARAHSGIQIYGDAYTWWNKAAGHFERASAPSPGAVLVLANYAGPNHAHLAVVHDILSTREIRVDHANWLNDGAVYVNDPVVDVSQNNDWSLVKVWNVRTENWGVKTYTVRGFILPTPPSATDRVARSEATSDSDESDASEDASEANREVARNVDR
jgi:hypothetical protein